MSLVDCVFNDVHGVTRYGIIINFMIIAFNKVVFESI